MGLYGDDGGISIEGGTTGVKVGNVSDRLKVDALLTQDNAAANLDAFGRLRVSNAETLFECTFPYNTQTEIFDSSTASGGTVTHDTNKHAVILSCTTTTNSTAIFQSFQYIKYHPGKSSLAMISGNLKSGATNVTKRLGLFDADNGMFFQLSNSTLSVVTRTKISGSIVDTVVNQADWNIDKLDGTGASGITLDLSKQQIFVIDFQWLGSGRIRFGFDIDGKIYYCHQVLNANNLTTLYNQFGDYPFRAEITNASATASTLELTCFIYILENGGGGPEGHLRSLSNEVTSRNLGILGGTLPLISIRKKSANIKTFIDIIDLGVFSNSADDFFVEIVKNGTLTAASWAGVSGYCEKDVSATAISGGTVIYSFYLRGSSSSQSQEMYQAFEKSRNISLGTSISGTSDIITIKVTALTAASSIFGFINYREAV